MAAYYNENDSQKAAWLRELMKAGLITDGEVDERDIRDVLPADIIGFTRCHWFSGIGVWDYALRCAGWPDGRRVWTGSCPCQPFSAAGKGAGFADERHLWPAWYHLIRVCKPDVVFGEQVASKDGLAWLDLVQTDLEAEAYAVGALDLCAAGFGAPHIRQRLFFVADSDRNRAQWAGRKEQFAISGCKAGVLADPASQRYDRRGAGEEIGRASQSERSRDAGGVADSLRAGRAERRAESGSGQTAGRSESRVVGVAHDARSQGRGLLRTDRDGRGGSECAAGSPGVIGELADANGGNAGAERIQRSGQQRQFAQDGGAAGQLADADCGGYESEGSREAESIQGINRQAITGAGQSGRTGDALLPTNGFWRGAEWIYCRDEKYRPIKPGAFPLVNGAAARLVRLRGYGDAICAPAAEEFIRAYMAERGIDANQ